MTTVCLSLEELNSASCPIQTASAKSATTMEDFLGWLVMIGVASGLGVVFGYSISKSDKQSKSVMKTGDMKW